MKEEAEKATRHLAEAREEARRLSAQLEAKADAFEKMQRQKNHQIDKLK